MVHEEMWHYCNANPNKWGVSKSSNEGGGGSSSASHHRVTYGQLCAIEMDAVNAALKGPDSPESIAAALDAFKQCVFKNRILEKQ